MFGTVDIKCRPLKLAYLVEPNSAEQVREAIRLSSTLWGGINFPIVSLYRIMPATWKEKPFKTPQAKEVIRGYLEAFDPDILVQFSETIPDFINEIGLRTIRPEEVWSNVGERGDLSPQFGIGIFEILEDVFEKHFRIKTKYPLKIILPDIPQDMSLFWASLFGEIPTSLLHLVKESYFDPLEIQTVDPDQCSLGDIMSEDVLFPQRLTQLGLKRVSRSGLPRSRSIYFLDATKLEDIVDFWNLRALGGTFFPLPKQLGKDPRFKNYVIESLKLWHRSKGLNTRMLEMPTLIRSRNSTQEEVKDYIAEISAELGDGQSTGPFISYQHWYPRFWHEWARNRAGEAADEFYGEEESSIDVQDSEKLSVRFRTLLPAFAHGRPYPDGFRCANEVSFRFYGTEELFAEAFPRVSGRHFNFEISSPAPGMDDWRVSRNGLVKLVAYATYETKHIPMAEKLFFAWLSDLGWKPQLSSGGLLAKQIYKQIGNLNVLKIEKLLNLLEHMNGGHVSKSGTSLGEDRVTHERDLPVGEVKNKLEEMAGRSNICEYLNARGVFKLGLKVQCPHCMRKSWFSLDSVRDTLSCPKCLNNFPAIGNLERAKWHYKTAGPFSVPNYAEGAYAVLLTLAFFSNRNRPWRRTTPVLSFIVEGTSKKKIEADFAMFWEETSRLNSSEGLLFAECKTYSNFGEDDWNRLRFLAEKFPGAILTFCTLRKSLSRQEIIGITSIAKAGRKYWKDDRPINPVLILTGTELLSHSSPPFCWEESFQHKFASAYGILDICEATQQIYLNLPSWHEEWEKQRKSKQKRRQSG